jgi:methyl-accepting chemotaxis protein
MNEIEILERLAKVEALVKNQHEKCKYVCNDFENKIQETKEILENMRALTISVAKLTEQMEYSSRELSEIKNQLTTVTTRPVKFWDKAVTSAISGIVALAISLIFN